METLFSVTHPGPAVLPVQRMCFALSELFFFFIRTIFWDCAYRSVQTLLQLENTPANGGSVVSRAQVLLLTTWTGFYFFLRQKTEIEHVRRRKQPTVELSALKFKQKQSCWNGSIVDRGIFLLAKATANILKCLDEVRVSSEQFPSSSTFMKINVLLFNLPSCGSDNFPAVPVALAKTNKRCHAESCFNSIWFPNEPAATVKLILVAWCPFSGILM